MNLFSTPSWPRGAPSRGQARARRPVARRKLATLLTSMPLSERIGAACFVLVFPAIVLAFAVMTP